MEQTKVLKWAQTVLIATALLGVVWAVASAGSLFLGVQVVQTFPSNGAHTGAWGPLGVSFDRPVQADSVIGAFAIEPAAPGQWRWDGQNAWFVPARALLEGQTYTVRLRPGVQGLDGSVTRRDVTWRFRVRPAEVAYLSPVRGEREVWRSDVNGGSALRLTDTGGSVIDFAVAKTGEQIVYAARNDRHGADLWLVGRDGTGAQRIADCGEDTCQSPAWSPDESLIAYSRKSTADQKVRIWTVELSTGIAARVYQNERVLGNTPSFSPAGDRLCFFDPTIHGLRVRSLVDGSEVVIQTTEASSPAWSPDGSRLIYVDQQPGAVVPRGVVWAYDFSAKKAEVLLGAKDSASNYGLPDFTADGAWLVAGYEAVGGTPSQQLRLFKADGAPDQAITDSPVYSYGSYQWDPAGTRIVFQQSRLGSQAVPDVVVWNRSDGASQVIASDATLPAWLP